MQPRNADAIALLDAKDGTADGGHRPHAFVSGYEGRVRLDGPIALRCVEIGMADPRRGNTDENLVLLGFRNGHFLDREWSPEMVDDGGFHRAGHAWSPFRNSS